MYYLTNYGETVFTKARLLGIAHEKYVNLTPTYDTSYTTRYDASVVEKDGQFALCMESLDGLPEVFLDKVVTELDGWFEEEIIEEEI